MDRKPASTAAPIETDAIELSGSTNDAPPSPGYEIVGELIKGFEADLANRKWRSVRLHLLLFAHLASLPRPLITTASLLNTLTAFASITEEYGVGANRADECVRIVLETLARLTAEADSGGLVQLLQGYMSGRTLTHDFLAAPETLGQYDDVRRRPY
jgi:nuclear cap-binding protein subunit 1